VRTATGVALIDLDAVARGPAAADLGHCCARILSDAIRRGRPRSDADALVDAIANGYATRRPLPSPAALAWHTAASLLARRAGRVVTAAKLDELVHLDAIVDLAAATVL